MKGGKEAGWCAGEPGRGDRGRMAEGGPEVIMTVAATDRVPKLSSRIGVSFALQVKMLRLRLSNF